jgi:23S rRNA (adenine2503-C2)-methyltransferase
MELDLKRVDAEDLLRDFTPCSSKVVDEQRSEGGGRKLVIQLSSGQLVETVLIRHDHESSGRSRHTVCVSSQVGCARACR